jgi:lipid A 3-O-deacylase
LFFAVGLGPAFNTGHVQGASGHLGLGSNVLIHPSVELGYEINHTWSISLFFDHSSNAGLARNNAGLSNFGVRTGLHF